MIRRLNHAVLFVRDAAESATFYRDVLGFDVGAVMGDNAYFMQAPGSGNDHDLALFGIGKGAGDSAAGRQTVGLYHLAWEVDTLEQLGAMRSRLFEAGALVGESDHGASKSLYARDPNGIEFEVMWEVPSGLRDPSEGVKTAPLDFAAAVEQYGAQTSRNT